MLKRLSGSAALAIAAALSFGPTAFADSSSGTHGDYLFVDGATHYGATCKYTQDSSDPSKYWISKITATAPSLWWPDQNGDSTTEHGKVGWRFLVQYSIGAGQTRETQSPIQKGTAYEDSQNPYGNSTRAHLTNKTAAFNGKALGSSPRWRIVDNTFWYDAAGHVMGNVNHVVQYYNQKFPDGSSLPSANPYCNAVLLRI